MYFLLFMAVESACMLSVNDNGYAHEESNLLLYDIYERRKLLYKYRGTYKKSMGVFHRLWEQRAGWNNRKDAPYHNAFIALL